MEQEMYPPLLIAALVESQALDPIVCTSKPNEGGEHLWMAGYHVEDADIDKVLDRIPAESRTGVFLTYFRAQLLGRWVVSGLGPDVSRAFYMDNELGYNLAVELTENYLGGGDE